MSRSWLRDRTQAETRVTPVELFFDLVYVLGITQVTHFLVHHPTPAGAGEAFMLLLALWSAWIYTAWATNWLDPAAMPVRLMRVGIMLAALVMSAAIPEAFGDRGLMFALGLVVIQVARGVFITFARDLPPTVRTNYLRILIWWAVMGSLWIAGGMAEHGQRITLWLVAQVLDVAVPWFGYPVPGMGRSHPGEWRVAGGHIAERCQLFIIIALGESILVAGARFGELPASALTTAAFVNAFIGSVALWWIYFDHGAEAGMHAITHAREPDELGRSAYSYYHIPMVAGIVATAAADEFALTHGGDAVTATKAALILGGPALYLAGNSLFNWSLTQRVPRSRLVAIGVLGFLGLVASRVTVLQLSVAATLLIVAIAAWDAWSERARHK